MDELENNSVEGTGSESSPGLNPAWNDVLSILPEELHSQVTPHFQKWDQAAQSRIEEVNRNLSEWEPYQGLREHNIPWDTVAEALRVHYALNTDPKGLYDAMAQQLGYTQAQAAQASSDSMEIDDDNPLAKEYKQLKEHIDLLSQVYLQDKKTKEAAEADAALNREIDTAVKSHEGLALDDTSMRFVLSQMSDGKTSAKAAVDAFVQFRNSLTPPVPAPTILGGMTGGVPSQQIDVTKMSGKDVRALVAEIARREAGS